MNRDDEIFAEALELSPTERQALLERLGAEDPALRARVEALLKGYAAAGGFMEESPVERPPILPEEGPGDRIGHYTLIRKLGEGGCGVVHLAKQTEPVKREVALKVIKLGMDTVEVITRFEAERQALAIMDHPDIARVFDAGATTTGRPFFVMEFVEGVPITRFCDEQNLAMDARLELFARVCVALQHAHQKGIIHRDIKPSNILVTMRDGVPSPKIIDFGIAKATSGRLTEHTLLTCLNQFIGTPAYMSPEQAEVREQDIDTRSDIYSLGVLLYELLTGRPPYDPKSLQQAGIEEIRRIIREVDPPRPSTAVSTLTQVDRTTVARQRRAQPNRLTSTLSGDLDWIVMRCLEKQRDRRYETAHELADDVRRHLRQEPVRARPPSVGYKTRRFIVRNKLVCASAAAVTLSLIVGTIVSTQQAIRATRAERVAVAERDAAESARAAETLAREDAQRRQDQAEELLTFMIGDFRTGLQALGRLDLLDAVGAKAMGYFADLDSRDLTDTALTRQAKALTQIGEVRMDQADYAAADTSFRAAYDRARTLAARYPDNGDMLFERAQAEFWIGFVARRRGESETEREWLTHYRDSTLALAALEPEALRSRHEIIFGYHNLAVLDFDVGDYANARTGFERELTAITDLLADHPDDVSLQRSHVDVVSWLGMVAEREGEFATAERRFLEMADITAQLKQASDHARWKLRHAQALAFIGELEAHRGNLSAAQATNQQAAEAFAALVVQDPANRLWQISRLSHQLQGAELALAVDQLDEARDLLASVKPELEALVAAEPTAQKFARHLASLHRLEAMLAWRAESATDQAGETSILIRQAIDQIDPLVANTTELRRLDRYVLHEFAQAHAAAGWLARRGGDSAAATREFMRVIDVLSPLLQDTRDWRLLSPAASAFSGLNRADAAAECQSRLGAIGYQFPAPFPSLDPRKG